MKYSTHPLVLLSLAFSIGLGWAPLFPILAQDASSEPAATSDASAAALAQFNERNEAVKKAFLEIESLRTQFQTADAAHREEIDAQLEKRVAETQPLVDAMIDSALEVYRTAPQADPEIEKLLVSVAGYYTVGRIDERDSVSGGDRFERALPIINALIEGKSSEKRLPVWGFVGAFVTNDYDLADRYWKMAQESGTFEDDSRMANLEQQFNGIAWQYQQLLSEYRPLWAKEQALREAEAAADDLPRVKLTTSKGDITIELFENEAPQAVANFLTLVKQGYYDGLPFHRVIPGFMAQGGDPKGDGTGGPGYHIRCECYEPNHRSHFRGSLSMAHAGRDTGGSQFFLTFGPTHHLNGKHTVFGRVIEGFDVLGSLERGTVGDPEAPFRKSSDRIVKAEVIRDRGHEYTFEKLSE